MRGWGRGQGGSGAQDEHARHHVLAVVRGTTCAAWSATSPSSAAEFAAPDEQFETALAVILGGIEARYSTAPEKD
ncbi:hypothetical protein ABH935_001808 [Catenulispora sp. GAS73]|uniref:hypothetical protein n=1 Tax=Catenulispora sp. GAS73 TaxID=3156269 RepID=UPI00351853FA